MNPLFYFLVLLLFAACNKQITTKVYPLHKYNDRYFGRYDKDTNFIYDQGIIMAITGAATGKKNSVVIYTDEGIIVRGKTSHVRKVEEFLSLLPERQLREIQKTSLDSLKNEVNKLQEDNIDSLKTDKEKIQKISDDKSNQEVKD